MLLQPPQSLPQAVRWPKQLGPPMAITPTGQTVTVIRQPGPHTAITATAPIAVATVQLARATVVRLTAINVHKLNIGWCIASDRFSVAFDAPTPLIPPKDPSLKKKGFLSCPAVRQFPDNIFQVTSPFSLKLRVVDSDNGPTIVPVYPFTSLTEDMVKNLVQVEPQDTWSKNNCAVIQIPSPFVFVADEVVFMEQSSPDLSVQSRLNWRVIPGRFDIYSWQRPLNWAFEWDFSTGDFEIRAGEPQYNVRFFSAREPFGSYTCQLQRLSFDNQIKKRLELTKDIANIRRGTMQLFQRSAQLRATENFLTDEKNESNPGVG